MLLAKRFALLAGVALWLASAAPTLGASCAGSNGTSAGGLDCVFEFRRGREGWSGGFADLPTDEVKGELFDLRFARVRLPAYLGRRDRGLLLAGTNRSDDLVMFVKRKITGLAPTTRYAVRYHLRLATNAGAGCVGIGGAPGESVYVKAGASTRAPVPVDRNGTLRLPIDIGNQSQGGRNAKVLGDIAAPTLGCDGERFALITRDGRDQPVFSLTDRSGNLWLFVGFDSGYEGRTQVILDRIAVQIDRVQR